MISGVRMRLSSCCAAAGAKSVVLSQVSRSIALPRGVGGVKRAVRGEGRAGAAGHGDRFGVFQA